MAKRSRKPNPNHTARGRPSGGVLNAKLNGPRARWIAKLFQPSAGRDALVVAALAATLFLVYQPAASGTPLWDDDRHLTPPQLQSLDGLRRIWCEPGLTDQYYPVVHSVFWLEHRLWQDSPWPYHLVNIGLHAAAAGLLLGCLRRLNVPGAALAAAIFALHPVQVESVAWISELKNTLSGVLYLAALWVYLHFDRTRSWPSYAGSLLLFCLAVLSKAVTATLPAAILVVLWWRQGRLEWKRDVRPLVPFFIVGIGGGVLSAWLERKAVGAEGAEYAFTVVDRLLIAGRAAWFYLAKLIWPANLSFVYPRWHIDPGAWWQYAFPLAAAGLLAALVRLRHRARAPLAGVLFFGGTLFPALGFLNVYPFRYSFVADHFQYLACIGIIALAAAAAAISLRNVRLLPRALGAATCMLVLAVLALVSWRQSKVYVNSETLFRDTLAHNPDCWMAYANLGKVFADSGRLADAADAYRRAIQLQPNDSGTLNNLGVALLMLGNDAEAAKQYRRVLDINPRQAEARANLGLALVHLGQPDKAAAECRLALQANPDSALAHNNLALALSRLGQLDDARRHCLEALRLKPDFAQAYNNLGNIQSRQDQNQQAIASYERALTLDSSLAEAHNNLGSLFDRTGRTQEAIEQYRAALAINPKLFDVHNNLGTALDAIGRRLEAVQQFQQAIELEPDNVSARTNLALVYRARGQFDEAIEQFRQALRIQPGYLEALNELGTTLRSAGRRREAIQEYEAALRIKPDFAAVHFNLATTLAELGQKAEAIEHYRQALRLAQKSGERALAEASEARLRALTAGRR